MTIFQKLSAIWEEDSLLRRLVRNSSYLFGSNVFASGLGFLQGIVIIRLIGVANLGMVVVILVVAGEPESFPVPAEPACGLVPFRGDFPVVTRVRPVPVSAFPFGELLKRAPAPERCVPVATIAWLR